MNAKEVAVAIRAWAQENHLFKNEFPIDLNLEDEDKDALFDSLAISHKAESVLRHRGITAVAFNDATNEVIVFTERSVQVAEKKILPQSVAGEVTIRYIHGGMAQAGGPPGGMTPSPYVIRNNTMACGGSIHPAKSIGAGTMGCLVRDAAGTLFGLTNNHVSGMCNYANIGEKILAPGHIDITANGLDPFTLGYHVRALPMVQGLPDNVDITTNSDAALIRIANVAQVCSYQGNLYDTPAKAFDMLAGQTVEKVGRTTGHTQGLILGQVTGPHPVKYNTAGFGDHISFFDPVFAIQGINPGEPFSQPGDSGSLITIQQNGERFAVGLVFAGNGNGISFALPLMPILATLGVTLVSAHN
ncbi:MAG: S1 family peptidase [Pseudomonadota bacterium]|nr:S1 family peptidase [Pseudomonadota bacterium]